MQVLDELFVGVSGSDSAPKLDEETWIAVRTGPAPWYEEYWWLFVLGAVVAIGGGYGIYRATR